MGLDAIVYRKIGNLQLGRDKEHAKLDPATGEVYFEDPKLDRKYFNKREAVAHRLGNVTAIGVLRDEVARLLGPESFLERKVIYSGSHSGDAIPLDELDQLSADLRHIRETGRASPLMLGLVSALEQLIQAARNEGNPIVFV